MSITVAAPAKINLYLDVINKREDGYHDIESIMHTVSLSDQVTLELTDGPIEITSNFPHVPTDEKNIAYKVAKAYFSHIGKELGVKIHIEKHIPVSSGLAGGSTDAAATLKGINALMGEPLNLNELVELGAKYGADIPFCITGGCVKCEGLGEKMTALPAIKGQKVLIVRGGEGVSTPKAYGMIDEMFGDVVNARHGDFEKAINAIQKENICGIISSAYNIFEDVILPTHSIANKIKDILLENGASLSMMSGSGPAVFGFFKDNATINNAASEVRKLGARAFICETI